MIDQSSTKLVSPSSYPLSVARDDAAGSDHRDLAHIYYRNVNWLLKDSGCDTWAFAETMRELNSDEQHLNFRVLA